MGRLVQQSCFRGFLVPCHLSVKNSPQSTKSILTLPVISCAVTSRVWLGHWRWWCTARSHPGPSTSVPLSWGLAWPPFLPVPCSGPKSTSLLRAVHGNGAHDANVPQLGCHCWLHWPLLNCLFHQDQTSG